MVSWTRGGRNGGFSLYFQPMRGQKFPETVAFPATAMHVVEMCFVTRGRKQSWQPFCVGPNDTWRELRLLLVWCNSHAHILSAHKWQCCTTVSIFPSRPPTVDVALFMFFWSMRDAILALAPRHWHCGCCSWIFLSCSFSITSNKKLIVASAEGGLRVHQLLSLDTRLKSFAYDATTELLLRRQSILQSIPWQSTRCCLTRELSGSECFPDLLKQSQKAWKRDHIRTNILSKQ